MNKLLLTSKANKKERKRDTSSPLQTLLQRRSVPSIQRPNPSESLSSTPKVSKAQKSYPTSSLMISGNIDSTVNQNFDNLTSEIIRTEKKEWNYSNLPKFNWNNGLYNFIAPNEFWIEDAKELFENAPKGIYAGVGTERCLFSTVLAKDITEIHMIDNNDVINYYNKINIELIKASPNRQTYHDLRFNQSYLTNEDQFLQKLNNIHYVQSDNSINLRDSGHIKWMMEVTKGTKDFGVVEYPSYFKECNYALYDKAFNRIKELADNDKIKIISYNISNQEDISKYETMVKNSENRISIYDISNAWWTVYVSHAKSPNREFLMGPDAFEKEGFVLVTDRLPDPEQPNYFYYMGFDPKQLSEYCKDQEMSLDKIFVSTTRSKLIENSLGKLVGLENVNKKVDLSDPELVRNLKKRLQLLESEKMLNRERELKESEMKQKVRELREKEMKESEQEFLKKMVLTRLEKLSRRR